jgi:hypothetical protein
MGRKAIQTDKKKKTVSIQIPNELLHLIDNIDNKSKFFNWLLEEHFNSLKK